MKKTLLATSVALALSAGSAQAAFFSPGSTGTITVTSGCFTFGTCDVDGIGDDDITDNSITVGGVGSGIAGDGVVGIMNFTVGVDGNSFSLDSYSMDTYTRAAFGNFGTRIVDTSAAGGFVDDAGNMTLDVTGRTGLPQAFIASLDEQPWNIDSHGTTQPFCAPGTGLYTPFTTGAAIALDCVTGSTAVSLAGTALNATGNANEWSGTLVSAGNTGDDWGVFDGSPYSEIYNITINTVPVPAAVWLFGSGLVALVGVARSRKQPR